MASRNKDERAMEADLRLLLDVSDLVNGSLDHEVVVPALARLLVPRLGDVCFIDLIDEHAHLWRTGEARATPAKERHTQLTQPIAPISRYQQLGEVVRNGRAVLVPRCGTDDLLRLGQEVVPRVRSLIMVPLASRGRQLGLLSLLSAESGREYGDRELALAIEVGQRAARAIDAAQAYQIARREVQAREDLLSIVSHDLRNPLGMILMTAEALLGAAPRNDRRKSRHNLEIIRRGAARIERLTADLLDLSSIEAGCLSIRRADTDVGQLLREAYDAMMPLAGKKSLTLRTRFPHETWSVRCDRDRVLQIFGNLVGNAVKFTPEGGTITIDAEHRPDAVLFTVRDSGPGIPMHLLPYLFDRHWRGTEAKEGSLGLGLFISKALVEGMGGTIWVTSQLGQGSAFAFTLPLAGRAVAAPEPRPSPIARGRTRQVLVVEDEEENRWALGEVLEAHGCRVVYAVNGSDAIERLRDEVPDIILLDLVMPVMDGRRFLHQIKADKRLSAIPVVIVSAHLDEGISTDHLGAVGYLAKPFSLDELVSAVQRHGLPLRPVA
jgi:signal transduction histidine kinase/CheY-like chemotaxis protein